MLVNNLRYCQLDTLIKNSERKGNSLLSTSRRKFHRGLAPSGHGGQSVHYPGRFCVSDVLSSLGLLAVVEVLRPPLSLSSWVQLGAKAELCVPPAEQFKLLGVETTRMDGSRLSPRFLILISS